MITYSTTQKPLCDSCDNSVYNRCAAGKWDYPRSTACDSYKHETPLIVRWWRSRLSRKEGEKQ
jgi:hypothetical protein